MGKKKVTKRSNNGNNRRSRNDGNRYERRERDSSGKCNREESSKANAQNDISWYTKYPNLSIAAASFPYPYRPGMRLPLGTVVGSNGTTKYETFLSIPGVMTLDWMPSFGWGESNTDPISVVAKEIYTKVRSQFSGSLECDAPDFMMYIGALDSLFAYIAYLKRIYRIMNVWTPENLAVPDQLLYSMGFSPATINNLRTNRTQFWELINTLVLQSRKFTCPAIMDYFNRHYWMSDNVYTDDNSINSQFYMFNLYACYRLDPDMPLADGSDNTGAGLAMYRLPQFDPANRSGAIPVTKFYDFGLAMINGLAGWDDAFTISGYLRRAYEGVPSFIVEEIPSNAVFTPVYEPEVLTQIENSRCLPFMETNDISGLNLDSFAVLQNPLTNAVVSTPSVENQQLVGAEFLEFTKGDFPPTLSVRSDAPTVADSIIASRLQCSIDNVSTTGGGSTPLKYTFNIICATEVPLGWRLYTDVEPTNVGNGLVGRFVPPYIYQHNDSPTWYQIMSIEAFDWHPFIWFAWMLNGAYTRSQVIGDVHNITVITKESLRNLHRVCVYSELNAFSQI